MWAAAVMERARVWVDGYVTGGGSPSILTARRRSERRVPMLSRASPSLVFISNLLSSLKPQVIVLVAVFSSLSVVCVSASTCFFFFRRQNRK